MFSGLAEPLLRGSGSRRATPASLVGTDKTPSGREDPDICGVAELIGKVTDLGASPLTLSGLNAYATRYGSCTST
jgi:hypothetical protein